MALRVVKNAFSGLSGALEDVRANGFWPNTFVSSPSPELPLHHHDVDIVGYVIEGETYVLDEDGTRYDLGPGDKLIIPAGARHAEGSSSVPVTYLVTLPDARRLMDALQMQGLAGEGAASSD